MRSAWAGTTGLMALMGAMCLAGCSKTDSPATAPAKGAPSGSQPGAMSVKRLMQRPEVANELRHLGLCYVKFTDDRGRSPAKLEDLQSVIERDMPKLYKGIQEGYYVVFWSVPKPSSNVVLAHEKDPDTYGNRHVLMGDTSVMRMDEAQLQEALKAK